MVMSEQSQNEEQQEVKGDEKKDTETAPSVSPGRDAAERPPGGDREPGSDGEEPQADRLSPGQLVEEQRSLSEPHGSTRMEMTSTDLNPRPLLPPEQDNMVDDVTVRVPTDGGIFQEAGLEIECPPQQKAFLGGYKHRLTEKEYHHAAVQTQTNRRPDRGVVVFSRDTQTVELKSQAQQTPATASTQTAGVGHYVSCVNDKLVTVGVYITAAEFHDRRLRAVIRLQTFARRWLAQQKVDRLVGDRNRRLAWLEMKERKRRQEKEEQHRRNQQSKEHFHLLYRALEKWRSEEEQQINSTLRGAERKAALFSLLEQETQLIATIGRQHTAVQVKNYDKAVRSLLDKSAAPRRWIAADGRPIQMENQQTIRARELRDLYNEVTRSAVRREERRDILLTLRHTVKEEECQLARDIVDLVDREVDLMTRGLKAASLEGLRKRISTLFLQYIKTPVFNPELARLLEFPQNPPQQKRDLIRCRGCHRYLHSSDFSPAACVRLSGRCRHCTGLDHKATSNNVLSCYKNLLRRLRADEQRLNKDAKIPFLLQVEDVRYLVEMVWAKHSAISASGDLDNLVFARWERRVDWNPWNCILLSEEEASVHLEVEDIHTTYNVTFIRWIKHKHMLARRHFSQIPAMADYLDSQVSAALGNQLVTKPVTMATSNHTIETPPASAH